VGKVSFEEFNFEIFPGVYPPAEDSFMLAERIRGLEGDLLDVGTGCGIQAIAAKKAKAVGVDVNELAVLNAKKNAETNKSGARFFVSDLFSDLDGTFDFIVFNPPYLPTTEEEKLAEPENRAYDGGGSGRELIDRFLSEFPPFLKDGGELYLLLSGLSDNGESAERLRGMGFSSEIASRKHVGLFEELRVITAWRE